MRRIEARVQGRARLSRKEKELGEESSNGVLLFLDPAVPDILPWTLSPDLSVK